ncbi:MAG: nucleotidyl transferase AbiEii/AbiGii toxin family protein [Clostridia bacterium]|nr:nucleotidyl transferase AbiEii/AbiGii toxin family protein [Clostridia bacterium]
MYNEQIKTILESYKISDIEDVRSAIREVAQKLILVGLSRAKFFNHVAFYGGTCLRMFHKLDRFSEDLDFTLIDEDIKDDFVDIACESAKRELLSYGIEAEITKKENTFNANMIRRFFKITTKTIINDYFEGMYACHHEDKISIKLEIDSDKALQQGAKFETQIITNPDFAVIKTFDISSLFAGKLGAVLNRNWKTRVKGRDFYDFLFYISNNVTPNLAYLSAKEDIPFDINSLKIALREKFEEVDFDQAKKDVIGFVRTDRFMEAWSKELFLKTIDLIHN